MASILAFPAVPRSGGTVHVYAGADGEYEIGHESSSGDSWGYFQTFDTAQAAIVAGYRLARKLGCTVSIDRAVFSAVQVGNPPEREDF